MRMFKFLKSNIRDTVSFRRCSMVPNRTNCIHVLNTYLKDNQEIAAKIIKSKEKLFKTIPDYRIIENCLLCQEYNIKVNAVATTVRCLSYKTNNLQHRIFLLQDFGVQDISHIHITRLHFNMAKSVKRFCKIHNVQPTKEIFQRMIHNAGLDWNNVSPKLKKVIHEMKTTRQCYRCYMECYMHWQFGSKFEDILQYSSARYYSPRLLNQTIEYLTTEGGFTKKQILKHPYLLDVRAEDARKICNDLRDFTIGNTTVPELVRKTPLILTSHVDNIKSMLQVIKTFGITERAVEKYAVILTKNVIKFEKRVTLLNEDPAVKFWFQHPRALKLLCANDMISRHYGKSMTRIRTALTLQYIVRKELGAHSRIAYLTLKKHPSWKHVEVLELENTLNYLKKLYTLEEICKHIHIVLYPTDAVKLMLETVKTDYSADNGYNFRHDQYLSLCIYMFEKQCHFTGDWLWNEIKKKNDAKCSCSTMFIEDHQCHTPDVVHTTDVLHRCAGRG